MKTLDDIAKFYGTDKSSLLHDYCRKYEKYLPFERNAKIKILEIGVLGGQSLKMWREYYPNSFIVGIDIMPECVKYSEGNIGIAIGSQTDEVFLKSVVNKYVLFDMIIDDGSHMNSDVIFSFKHLFEYLKSQGIYIIEDVHTSYYPEYGGGRYKNGSSIEYFKSIADEINFFGEKTEMIDPITNKPMIHENGTIQSNLYRKDDPLIEQFKRKGYDYIGTQIESMNILNSLIIITKR